MNIEQLPWTAIHHTLDRRRSPLEDPRVQRHLEENPSDLDAILLLQSRLEVLARLPKPTVARRRTWPWLVAAAAILLLGFALVNSLEPAREHAGAPAKPPLRMHVLSLQIEQVIESSTWRDELSFDRQGKIWRQRTTYPAWSMDHQFLARGYQR